jgi:hypothetical protein
LLPGLSFLGPARGDLADQQRLHAREEVLFKDALAGPARSLRTFSISLFSIESATAVLLDARHA